MEAFQGALLKAIARRGHWRAGGEGGAFTAAPPWYFRTLESWRLVFQDCGLQLLSESWPIHPLTGRPASVVFLAAVK